MFGRPHPETRSHIAHAPSTGSIQSARISDCRSVGWKAGFEIEHMAPRVASRRREPAAGSEFPDLGYSKTSGRPNPELIAFSSSRLQGRLFVR